MHKYKPEQAMPLGKKTRIEILGRWYRKGKATCIKQRHMKRIGNLFTHITKLANLTDADRDIQRFKIKIYH